MTHPRTPPEPDRTHASARGPTLASRHAPAPASRHAPAPASRHAPARGPTHVPRFGRRVRRAYTIGLGLIALLSVGSFAVVDDMVRSQAHSAAVINVAGRQRMLSQRTARLAHSVFTLASRHGQSVDQLVMLNAKTALLVASVDQMEAAHEGLMRGDVHRGLPGIGSWEERRLYDSVPHRVDERVRGHVHDARRVIDDPTAFASLLAVRRMTEAADRPLLEGLHAVVQFHERVAGEHTVTMRRAHLAILAITLLALVVEALVIFRPLVAKLMRTERSLAGRKAELWHQSRHDQLTGLPNRRALREAIEAASPAEADGTHEDGTGGDGAVGRDAGADGGRPTSTASRRRSRRRRERARADGGGMPGGRRAGRGDRCDRHRPSGPFAGPHAVLAIDLDNFKRLNDTVGHEAGDDLLRAVGHAIAREIRDTDLAVRLGGDEFVVVVPLPPADGASDGGGPDGVCVPSIVATRLAEALHGAIAADPRARVVSASIGVAVSPQDGESFDAVMANADVALYHAKATGRDRWVRFEPAMREAHDARDAAETMLREGLARDAFVPHFQPQVNLRTGETVAVEALARLIGEDGRPVPPAAFLPAAEASGLIVPLGRRVIERAIEAAAGWERGGVRFGRMSVNASAAQLRDPDFAPFLVATLEANGLPPARLAVEVLETVVLDRDGAGIIATCRAIAAAGMAVELDDFGTGYASIANVEALGVGRIKIDRSILAAAPSARRDVLRAIVTMAGGLDVDVMAEGVETAEDGARLLALGCVEAQGYHLARPMPAEAMGEWLDGRGRVRDGDECGVAA